MQTVFMILTNVPPAGLGEGGCNSTLLSQSPVCVHWNQQEFGHQFQGELEWGLNSLCNHVCNCFFSIPSSKAKIASWCWDSAKSSTSVTPKNLRMGTLRHTSDFSQWKPSVPPSFFSQQIFNYFSCKWSLKESAQDGPLIFFSYQKNCNVSFKPLLLHFLMI